MGKVFSDCSSPEWVIRVDNIKNMNINTIEDYRKQFIYGKNETGTKHSGTKSHIKLFDNGNVEIFAGGKTGITLDNLHGTINLYGNATNVNSYNLNLNTRPNGLSWNGYILNPSLYQLYKEDFRLEGSVKYWVEATEEVPAHWSRRAISIRPFTKYVGNNELANILDELKIPR